MTKRRIRKKNGGEVKNGMLSWERGNRRGGEKEDGWKESREIRIDGRQTGGHINPQGGE